MAPPERRNPGTPARATSTTPIDDTDHNAETDIKPGRTFTRRPSTPKPLPRICPADVPGQLRARRVASQRMVSLDCGCRDPWPCRCSDPPLSENMIDAGRAAALHILNTGNVPLLELEVLRTLYRRGGTDRALAQRVWDETGGLVT